MKETKDIHDKEVNTESENQHIRSISWERVLPSIWPPMNMVIQRFYPLNDYLQGLLTP